MPLLCFSITFSFEASGLLLFTNSGLIDHWWRNHKQAESLSEYLGIKFTKPQIIKHLSTKSREVIQAELEAILMKIEEDVVDVSTAAYIFVHYLFIKC